MMKPDVEATGGSERCVLLATEALRSLGHSVYLVHSGPESKNTARFSGELSLPPLFERAQIVERRAVRVSYGALREFIAAHEIDVVHLNWMLRTAVMRRLVCHVPVAMTPHNASCPNKARFFWKERLPCDREIGLSCLGGYFTKGCGHLGNGQPYGLPGFLRSMVEDRYARATIARCHRVIAGSSWMAEYLTATGTPSGRIRIVEPPIATLGPPTASPIGPPLVTFVGRLVGFKGADHVLRVSQRLGVDHRVAIAGDGVERPQLEKLAAELGVADRVDFLGALGAEELDALRRRSSVVVVPSLSPEVFGLVGPEALALGVPVVAYQVGGTSHWLEGADPLAAGVEVGDVDGLANAVRRFLAERPGDVDRRAVARSVSGSLSPRRHGCRLVEVYQEAQAEFARPRGGHGSAAPPAPTRPDGDLRP